MGGMHYVSIIILASLLVFGCLGAPQETPPAGPTTPSGGAAPSDTTPAQPSTPSAPSGGLEGLSYEALLVLGQSLECDITSTYPGAYVTSAKMYIKGGSEDMRIEATSPSDTQCPTAYYIMKGDTMYITCSTGSLFQGTDCDWIMIEAEPSEAGAAPAFERPDFTDVPPSNIHCKVWIYDDTKFQTPGTVCTMEDIFQGMYDMPQ